jgi:hypothetical protein
LAEECKNCSYFRICGAEAVLNAYVNRTIQNYNVWTKIYKRDFLLGIDAFRVLAREKMISHSEDLLLNVLCALHNPIYVNVPRLLIDHKQDRHDSLSNILGSTALIRKIEQVVTVYETLRECAGDYLYLVEELIARSAKYNYRRIFGRCSEADLSNIKLYLEVNVEARRTVADMLIAAELDRRLLVYKLNSTTDKLRMTRIKKGLVEEKLALWHGKKHNRNFRAKFNERSDFAGGLYRIGIRLRKLRGLLGFLSVVFASQHRRSHRGHTSGRSKIEPSRSVKAPPRRA